MHAAIAATVRGRERCTGRRCLAGRHRLCDEHPGSVVAAAQASRLGLVGVVGVVRRRSRFAVVGRVDGMEPGRLPPVLSQRGRAQRSVAGARHRLLVGRKRGRRHGAVVARGFQRAQRRHRAVRSDSVGCVGHRPADGQRRLRRGPSRTGCRGVGCRRARDHRRGVVERVPPGEATAADVLAVGTARHRRPPMW